MANSVKRAAKAARANSVLANSVVAFVAAVAGPFLVRLFG